MLQWPRETSLPFTAALHAASALADSLDEAEVQPVKAQWTVLKEAHDTFFLALKFLIDLGELQYPAIGVEYKHKDFITLFNAHFCLGGHSFQPIIDMLKWLYTLAVTKCHNVSPWEFTLHIEMVNCYSTPLHSLLLHFCTSVDQSEHDPPQFAELHHELQYVSFCGNTQCLIFVTLQEAEFNDKLRIAELHVNIHSINEFEKVIIDDFGSVTDASKMHPDALLIDDLGINGYLDNVVDELLNILPLTHESYTALFDLLGTFSVALAWKMWNWKKVLHRLICIT